MFHIFVSLGFKMKNSDNSRCSSENMILAGLPHKLNPERITQNVQHPTENSEEGGMRNTALFLSSSIFIPPRYTIVNYYSSTKQKLSSSRPPLFSTVRYDLAPGHRDGNKYYAGLASKLALAGRFEDFLMLTESMVVSGVKPSEFVELVNLDLVWAGIVSMIREGKIKGVARVLEGARKLGFCSLELFNKAAVDRLSEECRQMLKCGQVEDVVDLTEILAGFHILVKIIVDPAEVIKVCVNQRNPNAAIRFALTLPDARILFCTIIQLFGKNRDLASAMAVFEASKQNLTSPNMYIYRAIIDACGLCGEYLRSRSIYEELIAQNVTPNIYVFNSLMNVNASDLSYTLQIYIHMKKIGVAADVASFNVLLKSCCLAARVDLAQEIYRDVQILESKGALKLDLFTYSTIIKVFADAKMWEMALQIKEDMMRAGVKLNTITWSSLISSCAKAGVIDQALNLFEEMVKSNCEPNSYCLNILINACVKAGQYDRAFRLFHSWKKSASSHGNDPFDKIEESDRGDPGFVMEVPFAPSTATYNTLLKACGSDIRRAIALINEMKTVKLSPNLITWSTLIDVCGGAGNVQFAVEALESMREAGIQPDVVAYTAAIKVCLHYKQLDSAFSLYSEMKILQIQPNQVTYDTLLKARTKYGSLQEVQQCLAIYQDMRKAGFDSNDYYVKELIEEWCEGILTQENNKKHHNGVCSSKRIAGTDSGPPNLILEKVASHLQESDFKSPVVDLRGLSKVEARIVVLVVLRMIKENFVSGNLIEDDMLIILGVQKAGAKAAPYTLNVSDAVINLLQDELGLEVLLTEGPRIISLVTSASVTSTRIPALLQRLKVTKKSLHQWLEKRKSTS